MKLSDNGYYVERYVKCCNCGLLIYKDGLTRKAGGTSGLFCSEWCVEWFDRRESGTSPAPLPLPREANGVFGTRNVVTMNILDSAMVSICREMGILMMKTSYSTIFNEGLDFTCALADRNGDLIAVGEFCPSMIGGMPLIVKTITKEIPLDSFSEGDVVMHNDPHRGGLHLPEHTLIKPFYVDGELLGFAACIGHVAEIGGTVPGAFNGEATEIFHEGLCVPPVRIRVKGEDNVDVWKMLLANVRTPKHNYGDFRAMIGAVDLGVSRITELVRKYGKDVFVKTCQDLMDYSETCMRAELAAFPDGHYTFEDFVENDGIEAGKRHKLHVDVYVQGDEIVADFTGTDPQARGPINATLGVAMGATYNAFLHLTDPSIPKNSGAFRPLRIVAKPGTLANVNYPAPEVAGNTELHPRFAGIVFGAMSKCVPDRVMASEAGTGGNFVFGGRHPDTDDYYVCYDVMFGGWGGRADSDGNDAVVVISGNCRLNPTEVFETRYPWRVENFAISQDSGGAGTHRGGLGFTRTLVATAKEITVSQCTDHHEVAPWSLFGGQTGGLGSTFIQKNGSQEWQTVSQAYNKVSTSKFANIRVLDGDRIKITVPGGGGYGDPSARSREQVKEDLLEGFISEKIAREVYGFSEEADA
ncbi:hydantoinase B/oxoprolinase family protein [Mesorhizobium sp. B2-1-3A]|uniref:hydantoinase B/oxoprolinase family protein n=1 Tax=Mesorhizobium sp. B2-1-3A TaxID=2589971 RepID=UPI00112CBD68|nr:hydantoinase B/oxoprolinase family protein [Mesorhizobium sp. B2-1-3A]TPM93758.1 hydantoinase B/oxoprolinase family protein [Mesorhizobium sp. B2-1-3A]